MVISRYGAVVLVALALCLSGCAYQTSRWREAPGGGLDYRQTNVTPPFGKQAESAGQMSATVLEDGTWELVIGRTDRGVDNAAQAEVLGKTMELLGVLGRMYGGGGN